MVLLLTACATAGNLAILDSSKREQIKVGATKSHVQEMVGAPASVYFGAQGQETWSYTVAHVAMNPAAMIPVVGLFANDHNVESTSLVLMFNDEGKVQKIAYTEPTPRIDVPSAPDSNSGTER